MELKKIGGHMRVGHLLVLMLWACNDPIDIPEECDAITPAVAGAMLDELAPEINGTWSGSIVLGYTPPHEPQRTCTGETEFSLDVEEKSGSGYCDCTFGGVQSGKNGGSGAETWTAELEILNIGGACVDNEPEGVITLLSTWTRPDDTDFVWGHLLYASNADGLVLNDVSPMEWWTADGEKGLFMLLDFDVTRTED